MNNTETAERRLPPLVSHHAAAGRGEEWFARECNSLMHSLVQDTVHVVVDGECDGREVDGKVEVATHVQIRKW